MESLTNYDSRDKQEYSPFEVVDNLQLADDLLRVLAARLRLAHEHSLLILNENFFNHRCDNFALLTFRFD